GSLIAEDIILTAAHCVAPTFPGDLGDLSSLQANEIEVAVGAHDLKNIKAQDRIGVSAIYFHPNFVSNTAINVDSDIALLKLVTPVKNATLNYIDPILMQQIVHNDNLTAIGWGVLNDTIFIAPDILQEVQLPYVNFNICNDAMLGQVGIDSICAGPVSGGKSPCYGDSGGPLLYNNNGKYFQVGIVSWGNGCGTPDSYGVYTKVSYYNDWIVDSRDQLNMTQNNYFGAQGVNVDSFINVRAVNWSTKTKTIKSVSITGNSGFNISKDTCTGRTLAANQPCNLKVKFDPDLPGSSVASLEITTESGKITTSLLSGVGLALVDLNSAVDTDNLKWYTGGDAMWSEDSLVSGSINGSALKTGEILDGEASYVSTHVKGSGTLTFNWRLSSNINFNLLYVVVDRKIYTVLDSDTPWTPETIVLGAGEHIITWGYMDTALTISESNAGWIDNVSWVKNP
ncbi:MAG: serine protease, partial [Thiohalomonadales bacterium]